MQKGARASVLEPIKIRRLGAQDDEMWFVRLLESAARLAVSSREQNLDTQRSTPTRSDLLCTTVSVCN